MIKPEQRVAARVVEKYKLTVPIDVERLAKELADVEEEVLPVKSDAVVLTPNAVRERPLIILNANGAPTRRRFTLAHELGHLLIPWHMGTFACHTTGGVKLGEGLYLAVEAESNRFASELLLPSEWLRNVVSSGMSPGQMLKFVRSAANVSTTAATLALCQALQSGFLFAVTNAFGFVELASASPGSRMTPPSKGDLLDVDLYSKRCSLYESVIAPSDYTVHWWRYGNPHLSIADADGRTSAEILKSIIASVTFTPQESLSLTQSISGIIGAANSSRKPETTEELLGVLFEAFAARPNLTRVTSHPDFDAFLVKRATEITARRPKG
jgi:hypothetical protein